MFTRAATCTPVDFVADDHFFGRDSGLLCRGLQQAGADCVCIMPGKSNPIEAEDLIRCTPENLRDSEWWRSRKLDFVVLYAWGDPIYQRVADAIRGAGIFLIQNLDTAGIESPHANPSRWITCLADMFAGPQPFARKLRILSKGMRDLFPAIYENRRLTMIDQSDLVAAVSPPAAASMNEYANALGFSQIADKLTVIPHPVPEFMTYGGEPKENHVICVGRWLAEDVHQKDPETLLRTLRLFLESQLDWRARIVGRGAPELAHGIAGWPPNLSSRIEFTNAVDRLELRQLYLRSKILLCPSRFESYHISSAEALCCGCSVVVARHPLLASTAWFTTAESGTLATSRRPADLATALIDEAEKWRQQSRSSEAIANSWSQKLHAPEVARNLLREVRKPT